jgi:hypothetical protein
MHATAAFYASQNAVRSILFPELNTFFQLWHYLPLIYAEKKLSSKKSQPVWTIDIALNIKYQIKEINRPYLSLNVRHSNYSQGNVESYEHLVRKPQRNGPYRDN